MFVYIWEFIIKEDKRKEFLQYYKPGGEWCNLFKKSDSYIKSELLNDKENSRRFISIDYWKSKELFDLYNKKYSKEYDMIDKVCTNFTNSEKFIGYFECD